MDFNHALYVFNGVPGLEVSKGERIVKALQKLQTKIKHLEQVRKVEKEAASEETQTSNEGLTITDIKFKLLVLQLQYLRSVLKKNLASPECNCNESLNVDVKELENFCKETQTGTSLYEHIETEHPHDIDSIQIEVKQGNIKLAMDTPLSAKSSLRPGTSHLKTSMHQNHLPSGNSHASSSALKDSHQHYHLKINDVPFILGASSSASHNIVANVQNILAMMKSHNKALCGSKPQTSRNNAAVASSSLKSSSLDTNDMLKNLSEGLSELHRKQAYLIERLDIAQKGNHFKDAKEKSNYDSNTRVKQSTNDSHAHAATIPVNPSGKKKIREMSKKEKHAVPSNRIQSNLPQVTRQRLLRSIQEFKTQLTEEDISWD